MGLIEKKCSEALIIMIPNSETRRGTFSDRRYSKTIEFREYIKLVARFVPGNGQCIVRNEHAQKSQVVKGVPFDPLNAIESEPAPVVQLARATSAVLSPLGQIYHRLL